MKNGDARIGVAWREPVEGHPERSRYSLALSLGLAGQVPCRIVENGKREDPKAPTHLIFHTPFEGEDIRVGALWPHTSKNSGAQYLLGQVDVRAFGQLEVLGGVQVDFRRVAERVGVRLSKNESKKSDRSPTHFLWKMEPISKEKRVAAAAQAKAEADAGDMETEFLPEEEEESFAEEV
jgi:uncharacterized protein (DUF736 family)